MAEKPNAAPADILQEICERDLIRCRIKLAHESQYCPVIDYIHSTFKIIRIKETFVAQPRLICPYVYVNVQMREQLPAVEIQI